MGGKFARSLAPDLYSAALYRYATDGQVPAGFDGETLQQAFRLKKASP